MKTREELEELAAKIGDLLEGDFPVANWNCAVNLLNDLHSEGMRDAVKIIEEKHRDYNQFNGREFSAFILSAIENKPKL